MEMELKLETAAGPAATAASLSTEMVFSCIAAKCSAAAAVASARNGIAVSHEDTMANNCKL